MAKYTMELGDLIRSGYNLFDFDYPCIAGYRTTFERKFILEFYDREINFLSADEFKRHLNARLNLIMPYYVQLQKSEHLIESPFRTYKMVESTRRSDDESTFIKSIDTAALTEGIKARMGQNVDLISKEGVGQHEEGTKDGTLDRDTTDHETIDHGTVTTEKEKTVTDRDTTGKEDTKRDGKKDTTYEEDKTGSKTTLFSDTPQENFVLGDSDSHGNPLSSYATTYTRENTTEHKEGEQHDTTQEIAHTDTEGTEDVTVNRDLTRNEDEDTERNSEGTVDDVTHEEYEDKLDRETDFKQNTKTSQQTATDRVAENTDIKHSDRLTRGQAITAYGYEGYKQVTESSMLQAFRATFLNIDREIFRECETLFLGVY